MTRHPTAGRMALAIALFTVVRLASANSNATGLPTYPHEDGQSRMDPNYRSYPTGQHCIHYAASSQDPLKSVIDWYHRQLPSAKEEDVNKNSLYGSYFKLDGVRLLIGNDFINIYRMRNRDSTSIEIYKCKDAAH
jgi:hypothetical protein